MSNVVSSGMYSTGSRAARLKFRTGLLQVPGCSFCTKSLCFEHIKKPIGSCDEVNTS